MEIQASRVNVPDIFKETISVSYPSGNIPTFEEWFNMTYDECDTDRLLLDVNFTSYLVNNNYAKTPADIPQLQEFINCLPRDKKYFCICQYDLGVIVDFKELDVLVFNMSLNEGIPIPLLCQPHPYKFSGKKRWFCSFVGSRTHPVRDKLEALKSLEGYYVSYLPHDIEKYCQTMSESIFALCPRGFGKNSFRVQEAMQYGAIPVVICTDPIIPYNVDFEQFGVLIDEKDADRIGEILDAIEPWQIVEKQNRMEQYFFSYYTFYSNLNRIKRCLETEYSTRQAGANGIADGRTTTSENY